MIVAGFGFRAAATRESLADAFARAGGKAAMLATAEDKAMSPEMIAFGAGIGVNIVGVDARILAQQATLTHSTTSENARNTGSVAEAAALAAAGPGAKLLALRVVSADRMATCALAQGEQI